MKRTYISPLTQLLSAVETYSLLAGSEKYIIDDGNGNFNPETGEVIVIDGPGGPPSSSKSYSLWDDDEESTGMSTYGW